MVQKPGVEFVAIHHVLFIDDVNGTSGEWITGIVTKGEVLAWLDEGGVREEGVDNTAEHERAGWIGRE
jgi:hypothetical protein